MHVAAVAEAVALPADPGAGEALRDALEAKRAQAFDATW